MQDSQKNRDETLHNILAHDLLRAICERPVDVQESTGSTCMLVESEIIRVAEQRNLGDIDTPWKYNLRVEYLYCRC